MLFNAPQKPENHEVLGLRPHITLGSLRHSSDPLVG